MPEMDEARVLRLAHAVHAAVEKQLRAEAATLPIDIAPIAVRARTVGDGFELDYEIAPGGRSECVRVTVRAIPLV